jgi:serine protease Do
MNRKYILPLVATGVLAGGLAMLPALFAHAQKSAVDTGQQKQPQTLSWGDAPFFDDEQSVHSFLGGGSWLGVETTEVTADKVKQLKLPAEHGVLLGKIVPESPAAKAGLKENDVVMEINGQRVEGTAQFRRMIREIPAGRTTQLTLWRDGRSQNVSVTLGKSEARLAIQQPQGIPGNFKFHMPDLSELPELSGMGDMRNFSISTGGQPKLGIDAEDLQGELGNFFGAPEGEGILVRDVFPDSPAAKAGLKAGDVITSVDGDRIRSLGDLREKMLSKHEASSLKIGLLRNKSEMSVTVELPENNRKEMHRLTERTNI